MIKHVSFSKQLRVSDDYNDYDDVMLYRCCSSIHHTQVFSALIPEAAVDDRNVVVEVSAGIGGQEAMLFCQEMFNLYLSYAQHRGWQEEVIDYETTDIGELWPWMLC